MRKPSSNPQSPSLIQRPIAKLHASFQPASLDGRGLKTSRGRLVAIGLSVLLLGGISLATLIRERSAKSEGKAAPSATTTATPAATSADKTATTAANIDPTPAKAEKKHKKSPIQKSAVPPKQNSKAAAATTVEVKQSPATPAPQRQIFLSPPATPAEKERGEEEDPNIGRTRASWFFDQRAYPNKHIPEGALQKAIEQRDAMKQQQRAAARSKPGANAIISFPGDALWHLMGPQPVNEPFSANSGFPTASGRITAIAVDPSDATGNTVYIGGAAGGVWKSINAATNNLSGPTWNPLTDTQPSLAIGSITIDPNNPSTIYVGTGEENFNGDAFYGAGILKSINGGNTWTQIGASTFAQALGPNTGGAFIGQIAVQPGNSNIVLAAVSFIVGGTIGGIYRSADGGMTWMEVSGGTPPIGIAATGVVFESTFVVSPTGATAYAAMGWAGGDAAHNGIYKSTDSGVTWSKLAGGLPTSNLGRITLGYAPSTSGSTAVLYAAIADAATGSNDFLGLFKSSDGGGTWTQLGSAPAFCNGPAPGLGQCFYDMAVGVNPANANFVVVGGGAFTNNSTSLFKTTDGGTIWTNSTPGTDFTLGSTNFRPHVDTHAFAYNATTGTLFVGNDGGIWRTDNPGVTPPLWVDLNAGLATLQFYPGPSAGISDENYGFGGTQDNDTEVFSGTVDWTNVVACGDGGFTAIDSHTPTTVYTTCDRFAKHFVRQSVFNGAVLPGPNPTFMPADIGITRETMQFIPPLFIYDNNPNVLLFGTCRVWAALDAATSLTPTWNAASGDLPSGINTLGAPCGGTGSITTMDIGHSNGNVVLAGTSNGKVWETTTAGATWTEIDNLVPGQLPNRHVTAVRTKRSDSTGQIAYVTFSGFDCGGTCSVAGHVFKTLNGGTTWANISGDLPDIPVNDLIAYHHSNPTNFDALYIATDVGVFSCPDPEAATPCQNWTVIGDGLPNSPVLGLAMRRTSRILRAATHGRSMWQIQLGDSAPGPLAGISSVTPAAVMAGAPTTAVVITGLNFSSNTVVQFAGTTTGVTTTFVNTTQLNVTLNSSLFTVGGVFPITITDPAGVDSGSALGAGGAPFAVMNPVLNPQTMTPGTALTYTPVHFTLTGTNFVPGTILAFYDTSATPVLQFQLQGGTPSLGGTQFDLTTIFTQFTIPFTYNVVPFNPTPGGGINPADLIINGGAVPFTFTVTANPGPVALFLPSSIVLGPIAVGANTSITMFQIQNPGSTNALHITSATITGANAANFVFVAPTVVPPQVSCNFETSGTVTVATGGTCVFGMKYTAGTPPGNANSVATLNVTDAAAGNPQAISVTGLVNTPIVLVTPVNLGSVVLGGTSPVMLATLINFQPAALNVNSIGFTISAPGSNPTDFGLVSAHGPTNPACMLPPTAFVVPANGQCDIGVFFRPTVAGTETATIHVSDDGPGSPQGAPLFGVGVQITSISPSAVATGGPAFTLTVNGGGFASSAVVNVNGVARFTTFVSSTQLLASIPASDIAVATSLAISVTTPVPGGTPSEPKTLVVAQAPSATNDNINFATNITSTPFRIPRDTIHATTQLAAITTGLLTPVDPTPACAPASRAKSVWFKFTAPATGKVVADTRYSTYATNLSVWTISAPLPSSAETFTSVACASGNIPGSPLESFVGFNVTSGTTYYLMVTDASGTGLGGTLTFSLDFAAPPAPTNDDSATPAGVVSPSTSSVNSILATPDTNGNLDPTPPCAPIGAANSGHANSVWYVYTTSITPGTITADTLTSPYDTILNVTSGSATGPQVACNDNATINSATVLQSQVTFAAAASTSYFFMISSVLGDGGTTNFHLTFTPGGAGTPTKLGFTVQPTNTASTASITPAVQVAIQDPGGSTVTTATNVVTMNFGANPNGGVLLGTNSVPAVNGIATFSNLSIDKAGPGYALAASASGLAGATSNAFTITTGAATKLAFTVQPTNTAAGASITPALQVAIQDAGGNTVTTATNPVTIAIGINPGGGTLSGTTTVAAVNGIATFSNLSINKTGTGYTLGASTAGLTGVTSGAFNITPGPASKLAFSAQPTNVGAGAVIAPAVQVTIQDAQGNTVTTANNSIIMAIGTNPGGGTLSGTTTVAAVNGVASFSTLSINNAGAGYTLAASAGGLTGATSTAFNVTSGTAAKLAFTVQPTNVGAGSAITPAVQVTVQDALGNTVATANNSITMAIGTNPGGGTLSGTTTVAAVNGVAIFSTLSINNIGAGYTLTASAGGLTAATSTAFNVTSGTATKLAITVQPTNTAAGASITPAVQVAIQDAQGNTVTTATNSVTMAIGTNPGGGTLSGTVTVAAVNGVAMFPNLSINKTGTGYTLGASATGLTGATSSAFNITAGAATKLAFTVQPTNVVATSAITPGMQVTIQDAQGNTVTATNSITMAIGTNPAAGTLSGTTSVAAVNGVASFSNLSIDKAGTGYTLAASAAGLTGATSSAFNVTAGAATKLAFTAQPTNTVAGTSITPAVQVTIQDAGGNTVTATNSITMVIGTNPSGGTLAGTTTVAAVNGVASFSTLNINKTGVGYTLSASAAGLTSATSSAFNITAGAAAKLAITVQPTNVGAGSTITPAVQVTIQDAQGNTVIATNSITMAIGTNPAAGTLSGTTSVAAVNGVANFSNLSINNAGVGYTLAASAAGLTGATSNPFNVTSGTAAKLGFIVQPTNVGAGSNIAPPVQVAIQDAQGNTVTTATNLVTIAIGTNPAAGTLSGATSIAAVNGVATFSTLNINNVGVGYTLTATAAGLTSGTSNAFNVTSGIAAKLAFTVQPSNVAAGASITPAIQVTVQDAQGNTVTTATNMVTIAIGTNPGGGTLSGTAAVAAVNGVASFANLSIDKAGAGYTLGATSTGLTAAASNALNVTPGAAAKLAITVQPTNVAAGAAITPAVQVTVEDAQGNAVTGAINSITMAIGTNPGGGTLSGTVTIAAVNGVASFSTLSINKSGTGYTLTASAGGLTGATSTPFNVTTGAAAKLTFTAQPVNVGAGGAITPAVQVTIQDAGGNTITTATNSITIAIGTNPGGGTLAGTTTVAAVNGVATFSNLSINKAGTGYTLSATAAGLTTATSALFNITTGAAAQLAFTMQPSNAGAGSAIAPAVQVSIEDALGNTITTATNSITVAIGTNPAGGTLSGTVTAAAVNGVATFSNLSINSAGVGYTLSATAAGLTTATSTAFNITTGTAAKLAFTAQPTNVAAGAAITPAVQVTVQDAQGNIVTTATNSITIAIGTNPSGGALSGTVTAPAVNGVATFSTLNINKTGTGYTLGASTAGLTSATSGAFNVTAGTATKLAITVQPTNTSAGTAITPAIQVTIQDAQGNTVTTANNSITMAIGTNPAGGTLSGTATANAVNGVAAFANLSIDKIGVGYTLTASATGLTSATTGVFNITAGPAAKLAFTIQPTNTVAGVAITPGVQVTVEDAGGNIVTTSANSVTIAIGTNPGSGTLSGTATANAVNGVATFAALNINKTGTGYTLAASAAGLTSATSAAFNITPAAAAKLAITVQPSNVLTGAAITPAMQVTAQDALGNTVTTAVNPVTIAIGTNPSAGTLSGTTTVAAATGVASFSTLNINVAGVGYTLTAGSAGLAGATSVAFTVNNPVPTVTLLSPPSQNAGSATFLLNITGTGFAAGATVTFGSNAPITTLATLTATQITVNIPAADIATGGSFPVVVTNPAPGGGASAVTAASTFTVNNLAPTLSNATVSGKIHASGGAPLTLVLTGTNFVSTSIVNFGANNDTGGTVSNSGTTLTITIPAAQVNTAGPVNITVKNPQPGGGTSVPAFVFNVDGYTAAGPATPPSIKAGLTAMIPITITPTSLANGFVNPVTFTVTGLPKQTSFTFTPPSVTPNNLATQTVLAIVTKANGAVPPSSPLTRPAPPLLRFLPILWLASLLAGLYAMFILRRTPQSQLRRYAAIVPLALLLITGAVLAGCAGQRNGTPTGPAPLVITAASGSMSQTVNVTLTVQ